MKNFLVKAMVIALVVTLAFSASSCKGSGAGTTSNDGQTASLPEGIGDVDETVKAALRNSGDVTTYYWGGAGDDINEYTNGFQEEFKNVYGGNINYRIIVWEKWEQTFITEYAANNAPDVISIFDKLWPKVANRKLVYTVKELQDLGVVGLDAPILQENYEPIKNYFTYKDEVYSFAYSSVESGFCLVNKDLFATYEVKSPVEYYQEGQWNWDNFVKCSTEISRDTDSNGTNDIYGYYGWDMDYFVRANDAQIINIEKDGSLTVNTDDQKVQNALQNIKDLYGVKKVATYDANLFNNGNVGMCCWLATNIAKQIVQQDISFDWDIVPYPKGPDNTSGALPGVMSGQAVVSSTKNPQGAVNFVIASKAYNEEHYVPKDIDLESVFNQDQLDMINANNKYSTACLYLGVGNMLGAQWDFWGAIRGANKSVTEVLNTYKPLFQAQVDLEMSSVNS